MKVRENRPVGRSNVLLVQAALCAVTIAFTCMNWIRISFISNIQSLGFLKSLSAEYTIFESFRFYSKIQEIAAPIKYNTMLVEEILAIIIIALYVLLILLILMGKTRSIKTVSYIAMGFMIILFVVMMIAINTINGEAAAISNDKVVKVIEATPMPYLALVSAICVTLMNYFKLDSIKEKIKVKGKSKR